MIKVEGKGGITATIIADSTSEAGQRITTYELEYPRFIHAEFMTHRQFSRNAASSRAIPVKGMIKQVLREHATPIHWGKNQSGMQAKEEVNDSSQAYSIWHEAAISAAEHAEEMIMDVGLHKQVVNRILEPYQMIKVVCTATEYDNFFYLRDHEDAQPEIAELARVMKGAVEESKPRLLKAGEWHLPYITTEWCPAGSGIIYGRTDEGCLSTEDAIKVSASLCAQVSYRKSDESIEKALKIYDMLVGMKPVHASPFEHQATPMRRPEVGRTSTSSLDFSLEAGATHVDRYQKVWSGNFKGWVQNRQLIKGHVYVK